MGQLRSPLRHSGPVGGLSGHDAIAEELEEDLIEEFGLVGLALMAGLVGVEELDVREAILLLVAVLDR